MGVWLFTATIAEVARLWEEAPFNQYATWFYTLIGLALVFTGVALIRERRWSRWACLAIATGAVAGVAVAMFPLPAWFNQLFFAEPVSKHPLEPPLSQILMLLTPLLLFASVPLAAAIAVFWHFREAARSTAER